jgi:8-oxo-dGTP pyrophosphatase MutT (NUDIX family)
MILPEASDRDFTAGAFIIEEGKILLLKHRKLDKWMQPGGHVEDGETPDEAAKREALEETGYHVELNSSTEKISEESIDLPLPFNVNLHRIRDGHWHCDFQYLAELSGERSDSYEYSDEDIGWFSKEELEELDMPENCRKTCRKALDKVKEE